MWLNFISTQKALPTYGEPVLIIINGVLQDITFVLEGADDVPDWFEPCYFDHEDSLKIRWDKVDSWSYLQSSTNSESELTRLLAVATGAHEDFSKDYEDVMGAPLQSSVYKSHATEYDIIYDGWSRGFDVSQTVDELRRHGVTRDKYFVQGAFHACEDMMRREIEKD